MVFDVANRMVFDVAKVSYLEIILRQFLSAG